MRALSRLCLLLLLFGFSGTVRAAGAEWSRLTQPWPEPAGLADIIGAAV